MKSTLRNFFLFYVFIYASQAIYNTFLPLYFDDIGYSSLQIGTILSLGPFVAMLAQPIWGALSDRSSTKNLILLILIAGSGISMLLYPISDVYIYALIIISVFTLFQTSIFAISDTITLETIDNLRSGSFSRIRMGGTFGFAAMSLAFGLIAEQHLKAMFPIYAAIMLISFLLAVKFPLVAGHQSSGSKMSMGMMFRNKKLMIFLSFNFILQVTLGFYYSFFPIYYREMGGTSSLLGWSMVISSLSEVPFLLFAEKIFKRIKIQFVLIAAGIATFFRWILLYWITAPFWILPVQLLHGAMFIVLTVTMATYINREVPLQLKASGQTFNGLLNLGVARIIGSLAGGIAIGHFGLRNIFLYNAVITMVSIVIFMVILWRLRRAHAVMDRV